MTDTLSTVDALKALRNALLTYENANGTAASDTIGDRYYDTRAPDSPPAGGWPYAVARLETTNAGRYHGMRLDGTYEVQVFGRPWSQYEDVSAVADLFDQAMRNLVLNSSGLVLCHGYQRATLPPGTGAVDSEVCTIRLVYTLAIWPAFLTALTRVLPS